jgi:hypothetical protein
MSRRGSTLIEMLVGILIALLIGAGIFQLMRTSYATEESITTGNNAITNARAPVDVLADHLRNAQQVEADSYAVIKEAAESDITYYADTAGDPVRYRLVSNRIDRTTSAGTTTVATGVTSLSFKYYVSATYNESAGVTATTNPNAPTDAERPKLAVIEITATIAVGGVPRSYTTKVRLRNSPRKTVL